MSKVFIRRLYPYPTGAANPSTDVRPIVCSQQWTRFEGLLNACLTALGHEVIEQQDHPSVDDDVRDARLRVYAHKTKRDVAGDLFYKQMHLP